MFQHAVSLPFSVKNVAQGTSVSFALRKKPPHGLAKNHAKNQTKLVFATFFNIEATVSKLPIFLRKHFLEEKFWQERGKGEEGW